MFGALIQSGLHIAFAIAWPPLLLGVITRTKAFFAGRIGPPLLQPYYDIARLLKKGSVLSDATTWVFLAGPVAGLAATLIATLVVPLGDRAGFVSFPGDFLLVAALFGLGRFLTASAALDAGSSFEAMGAAREMTFSSLAEPALLLGFLVLARVSGALDLSDMMAETLFEHPGQQGAAIALMFMSLFILLLAENCRIPFDDPTTHLELTMIHEVMVLDHSGPALGMIEYARATKFFVFAALLVRAIVPIAGDRLWADWPLFATGTLAAAVLVGIVESMIARLRLARVPVLLLSACMLSGFGIILLAR